MDITSFGLSDVGKRRKQNEDRFLINDALGLYVVADGMGGHRGGACASQLAVDTIFQVIRSIHDDPKELERASLKATDYKGWLTYAVQRASASVHDKAATDESLRGMGTTVVAILIRDDKLYIANVGDSRSYLIRNERIKQLTEDHSLVSEHVKAGLLSAVDARKHRLKNVITRSVGFQPQVDVDVQVKPLKFGDRLLLCSDGLSNMLDDSQLFEIINENPIKSACEQLIDIANEQGGDDNITVVVLEVEEGESIEEPTIEL